VGGGGAYSPSSPPPPPLPSKMSLNMVDFWELMNI